jgi:hypothetical protein
MDILNDPVFSKNTIEFVTVANEYCKFIETSDELSLTEFVDRAHRLLPLLYLKGTLIPVVEEPEEQFNEKSLTEQQYNSIFEHLAKKFGTFDAFEEVYDRLRQQNDEPVQLSIAENLTDIYQDMFDFIMQYRIGINDIMYGAIWECRQSFEQYWGQRIVNILRVLHYLKYVIADLENETDIQPEIKNKTNDGKKDTSNWFISKMQREYGDEE